MNAGYDIIIHQRIDAIMKTLGIEEDEAWPTASVLADELVKSVQPFVTTQGIAHESKRKLAENNVNAHRFLKKYDELKAKNVRELDPLVYLLAKVKSDEATCSFLHVADRSEREERIAREKAASKQAALAASRRAETLADVSKQSSLTSVGADSSAVSRTVESTVSPRGDTRVMIASNKARAEEAMANKGRKEGPTGKQSRKEDAKQTRLVAATFPDALISRPYASFDFARTLDEPLESPARVAALLNAAGGDPLVAQERFIVEDLLNVFIGIDGGRLIRADDLEHRYASRSFSFSTDLLDPSIAAIARRCLPLASHFSNVQRFVEEKVLFEYGLVNHALAAAMRERLQEYFIVIAQLETLAINNELTLQKLFFYVQPLLQTMEVLSSIVTSINNAKAIGGEVLSLLHAKLSDIPSDFKTHELVLHLTESATVPYFEMLKKWLYRGVITDLYGEFFIQENAQARAATDEDFLDHFWERRYAVKRDLVPSFLERHAAKILATGKYLNVVMECERELAHDAVVDEMTAALFADLDVVSSSSEGSAAGAETAKRQTAHPKSSTACKPRTATMPNVRELRYTSEERSYAEPIDEAYEYASRCLMDLLVNEYDLLGRFRSVKHYFLLDQGDFIEQFLDTADDEMRKPVEQVSVTRLEALLELVLRTSSVNLDPYKDDLRIKLLPYDMTTHLFKILMVEARQREGSDVPTDIPLTTRDERLSGLEAFAFDYRAKWPLSLIFSRNTLTRYQMLFRQLFYLKHCERQLHAIWMSVKNTKVLNVSYKQRRDANSVDDIGGVSDSSGDVSEPQLFLRAFLLGQQMLHFVQHFRYYLVHELIEPNWIELESRLASAKSIDDVVRVHHAFLDNFLILTQPDIVRILQKLLAVTVLYCNYMNKQQLGNTAFYSGTPYASQIWPQTSRSSPPKAGKAKTSPQRAVELDSAASSADRQKHVRTMFAEQLNNMADSGFGAPIGTFRQNFSSALKEFLEQVEQKILTSDAEKRLVNLQHRLDFNAYYSTTLRTPKF